jgi:hypothetical protein
LLVNYILEKTTRGKKSKKRNEVNKKELRNPLNYWSGKLFYPFQGGFKIIKNSSAYKSKSRPR